VGGCACSRVSGSWNNTNLNLRGGYRERLQVIDRSAAIVITRHARQTFAFNVVSVTTSKITKLALVGCMFFCVDMATTTLAVVLT
jgi:hypothetical protein